MRKSIKRQLLLWLLVPLSGLAVISTIATYYLGLQLSEEIYDMHLLNSADSVVARVHVVGGRVVVDLPPEVQSMLRHDNHEEFYYQVITPEGYRVAGDFFMPPPPVMPADTKPIFQTINVDGKELRVVSVSRNIPDLPAKRVIVQSAETIRSRAELAGRITMSIVVAQVLLIACATIAIWIGVGRGLMPLERVERAVEARSPGDLSPLVVDEPVEVESVVKALNRLLNQLQQDVEMQKRFTANAAHQLRTPLAVLGTYCELANKLVHEKEAREALAEVEQGIHRMSKLVSRLLALSRSEPSALRTANFSVIDLNKIASIVTGAHVPEALRRKIELEFHASPEPALVSGNAAALEELISNLVENGILYTKQGGTVTVKVEVHYGKSILTVADEGPGIPEGERQRVFERFYRVPGNDEPGTGLGLAIVKEVATTHGAEIRIQDGANNKGTIFVVLLAEAKGAPGSISGGNAMVAGEQEPDNGARAV